LKRVSFNESISNTVLSYGLNASNTTVVTVSADYSSIVGQIIRHLSFEGEVQMVFSRRAIPDQVWDENFVYDLSYILSLQYNRFKGSTLLLVEAGVIRGVI
jgi:hypothetical protein